VGAGVPQHWALAGVASATNNVAASPVATSRKVPNERVMFLTFSQKWYEELSPNIQIYSAEDPIGND
jgi:hypothetical protein